MRSSLRPTALALGLLPLVLGPLRLASQQPLVLHGRVRAAADSSVLAGVRVSVVGRELVTVTAPDGTFSLYGLPAETVRVAFDRMGLVGDTVTVRADLDSIEVYLELSAMALEPVHGSVAPIAHQRFAVVAQTSTITLRSADLAAAPILAEPDPIRAVQLLPGTVSRSDFTVGLNVRGGESDQNLIRLDGVTVFNPFHLGGVFSTFDNEAVQQVDFVAGGFPAPYGGRLSSVLDVALRSGQQASTDVRGSVSLLSSKLLIDGPIGGSGITYLVGGRRTYADAVLSLADPELFPYYFADAMAKVSAPTPHGGSLSVIGYWGKDALDMAWVDPEPGREGVDLVFEWGNRLLGLNWEQPLGPVRLSQTFGVSDFTTGIGLEPDVRRLDNSARLLSAHTYLELPEVWHHGLRLGAGVEGYDMEFDAGSAATTVSLLSLHYRPTVWSAYVDDQWRPFDWMLIRPGVRVEYVSGGRNDAYVAPRAGVKAFLSKDLAITASAGRYFQAVHSVRNQDLPVTLFDFWIGADTVTPVARSDHVVVGFERWFGDALSVSVEGYAKSFDDLVVQNIADDPRRSGDEFLTATGYARGVDILVRKYSGAVTGWLAYGYVKAERESEGVTFPPSHDRRHTLDVVVQTRGPLRSHLNLHWGYGSPLPYSDIVGQWLHREYSAELNAYDWFEEEAVSTVRNGERFPAYSRLDVGLRWRFEKWGVIWQPYLQVINAYNRTNVWVYTFDYDRSPPTRTGFSQLPILPTFGLEFEF